MASPDKFEDVLAEAQAELQRAESEVFQFGQRARQFLQQFPAGLPKPTAVTTACRAGTSGDWYLHMHCRTPDEVAAWATWMDTPVKRDESGTAVFTSVKAVVDGLSVYVGCMTLRSQDDEQPGGDN